MKLWSILLILLVSTNLYGQRSFTKYVGKFPDSAQPPVVSNSVIPTHVVDSMYRWSWDTTSQSWNYNYKLLYTKDQAGNIINTLTRVWDGLNWVDNFNEIRTYDTLNNLTLSRQQNFDGVNWSDTTQQYFIYNSNSNLIEDGLQKWNGSNWSTELYNLYDCDSAGNIFNYIHQGLVAGTLQNIVQRISEFDSANFVIMDTTKYWISNNWYSYQNRIYTYDSVHNNIDMILQNHDSILNVWNNFLGYEYIYDSQQNQVYALDKQWNGVVWDNYNQHTRVFDGNNNLLSDLMEHWNAGNWQNLVKAVRTYDTNNNNLEYSALNWNGTSWNNNSKHINTYDSNNHISSLVIQDGYGIVWLNTDSFYYYYSCLPITATISPVVCGSYLSPSGNYIWTASGIYADTVLTSAGCDSIITVNLTINPPPVVTIAAQGSTNFCLGDSVILSAPSLMNSYQWYHFNLAIPGATSMNYTANTAGPYMCLAQDSLMCADNSNFIFVTIPCITPEPNQQRIQAENSSAENILIVSPNPGNGVFNVMSSPGELRVFNSIGEQVLITRFVSSDNTIDLSMFPGGMYLFYLSNDYGFYTQKIFLNK